LWPRQLERNGLRPEEVEISDELLNTITTEYTRESGVRQLERELGTLLRKTATRIASGSAAAPLAIDLDALNDVAQIDDTPPPAAPIGTPFDALVRRIQCMGTVLAKCVADDGRYHIPRALWRHVIDLCTDVAALPTFGKKRLEPLANIG
jgi:hypothetical protein